MGNTSESSDEFWTASPELHRQVREEPAEVLRDRGVDVPNRVPEDVLQEFARVVTLLWVDGQIVPIDQFRIDSSDQGLLFGRGAWESTRTIGSVPWLWPLHLDRLIQTAELLGLGLDPARLPNEASVSRYVRTLGSQDVVIRLNVTAGAPGKTGMVWMSAAPQPQAPASIRLRATPNPVQIGQAHLLMKTFQYATRLYLTHQARQDGFDTALLLDNDGHIQEAAHANLFVRLPDGWATPTAEGGLLPGTVRHYLLKQSPIPIRERIIPHTWVDQFQEAFVTNSNVGIVPVTQIDDHELTVGDDTRTLIRWLNPTQEEGVQYRFIERTSPPGT